MAALKASLKPSAFARRDGEWAKIESALLVPNDLVLLAAGATVPADCSVNEGRIDVDQAALTGESLPVKARSSRALPSFPLIRVTLLVAVRAHQPGAGQDGLHRSAGRGGGHRARHRRAALLIGRALLLLLLTVRRPHTQQARVRSSARRPA